MLTDAHVKNLVRFINEDKTAVDFLFRGKNQTAEQFIAFDEAARRFGFKGRYECLYVKSHCDQAESYLREAEQLDPLIKNSEAELAKPDLSPDSRKFAEETLARWMTLKKSYMRGPAEDVEVFRPHREAYQAAVKKAQGP